MKKISYILLVLSFTFSFNLFSCSDTNFYTTDPRLMDLEIKNQGDTNTCYAHTLSTVYNLEKAKNDEEMINPYWLGFVHKKRLIHWKPRSMNYSLLSWSWQDLTKYGSCDNSLIRSSIDKLKNKISYTDDQFFYLLESFFKIKKKYKIKRDRDYQLALEKTYKKVLKDSDEFEVKWNYNDIKNIFDPLRFRVVKGDMFKFLKRDAFKKCLDNTHDINGTLVSTGRFYQSNRKLARYINRSLKKGSSVAIGYCGRSVFHQDENSKNFKVKPRVLKVLKKKCGAHYSALVGSRMKDNKCQYLLRNSYGKSFWAPKRYECWCLNEKTGTQGNCQKGQAQKGLRVLGCWIPENKILTNTYDISYFR